MKRVVVSGYFDPLHVGHLENISLAKKLGDHLIVIINNDKQAILKKGDSFMKEEDRMKIISSLKDVDEVVLSVDKDLTVCRTLEKVNPDIFAKGGDRTVGEIPESRMCEELGIDIVDGLGKKIRASSEILNNARENDLL